MNTITNIESLTTIIKGEVFTDDSSKAIYATDASAYKEMPLAIAWPKHSEDIKELIQFANKNKLSLIPRGAGTSLAGQVVGKGIVVDMKRYFNNIIEVNETEKWVRVQPGVVLDELNKHLKQYGLFFGPETSTANRCVLGGMVGNNSCGSHSIIYGSTRDHTLELNTILSDGSEVSFSTVTKEELTEKCKGNSLESKIYSKFNDILSNNEYQEEIRAQYPEPSITRRNTGYALDLLLDSEVYSGSSKPFNMCNLLCGSEGTLAFITEIKLNLIPLPPTEKAVIAAHFKTKEEAFLANLIALKHSPGAVELMDDKTLNLTKSNIEQEKNRFFIKDNPAAVLIIEFERDSKEEIIKLSENVISDIKNAGYGYHFPVIWKQDIGKIWALRKAGLGLLANMVGDAKAIALTEDTAIAVDKLYDYLEEFDKILKKHKKECVYWGHIGSGELHLRPILNLKDKNDVEAFHSIGLEVAHLVKKYKGSLSGEHGDGRLRGEFIPIMLGDKIYSLLKEIKDTWDPNHIFNPEKIVDTPSMNTQLRYEPGVETKEIKTIFNFEKEGGIIRAAEKCNGSGDCLKTVNIGGTMCPSYMATREEHTTTRARANVLREFLSNSQKVNPFDHKEIYDVLNLCLSCKACKSECPSSIDIAKLKAEFLQHYYDANGMKLRDKLIANISKMNKLGSIAPSVFNFVSNLSLSKKILGIAPRRKLPTLQKISLKKWMANNPEIGEVKSNQIKEVYLFIDEFTNFNDTGVGKKAVGLLTSLGYKVNTITHDVSGRTYLSKGMVRKAKTIAINNVNIFKNIISENTPLLGIEPSAILCFRDEYPDLVEKNMIDSANSLAKNCLLIDEFLTYEYNIGHITGDKFSEEEKEIKFHGHCQQKAISSTQFSKTLMSIPKNYTVTEINSGCCGMAGSFGYEKEHYDLSMKVGELVLFPEVRKAEPHTLITATGTSCRHQIKDGTGKNALHPVEVLYNALI